jgi:hypothetical protein
MSTDVKHRGPYIILANIVQPPSASETALEIYGIQHAALLKFVIIRIVIRISILLPILYPPP